MGSKRIGLKRMQALLENVKRELDLTASTLAAASRQPSVKTIDATGAAQTVVMTEADYPPGCIVAIKTTTGGSDYDVAVTLPAAKAGLEYTVVSQNTPGAATQVTLTTPVAMGGVLMCADGTEDAVGTNAVFGNTFFEKGTQLFFTSDGVTWHVKGFCPCDLNQVEVS